MAYVDVDVILFQDFTSIFGRLKAGETEFIVASPSFEYVYNDRRAAYPFLDNVLLFNDGFWVTSNKYLKLSDFLDTMAKDAAIFHDVRKRGQLFAQPLVNFVTHRRGLKIALLPDVVANASHESFYKAPGVTFAKGKPLAPDGKECCLHTLGGRDRLAVARRVQFGLDRIFQGGLGEVQEMSRRAGEPFTRER